MKKIYFMLILTSAAVTLNAQAQQQRQQSQQPQQSQVKVDPARMVPGMLEIMEPVVKIIQPGATNSQPPSDAIILFDGTDINKEWEDTKGNPSKWIVKDGDADQCQRVWLYKDKTEVFKYAAAYRMEVAF